MTIEAPALLSSKTTFMLTLHQPPIGGIQMEAREDEGASLEFEASIKRRQKSLMLGLRCAIA